jgi:hypothetical protein
VFETDLGEFIVQLRDEPPYHIVTPAMHLTRKDIAALFKEKLGGIDTDDPQQLVAAARHSLRRAFFNAENPGTYSLDKPGYPRQAANLRARSGCTRAFPARVRR